MAAQRTGIEDLRTRLATLRKEQEVSPEIAEIRLALFRVRDPNAIVRIDAVRADDTAIAVRASTGYVGGAMSSYIASQDVDAETSWSEQMAMVQAVAVCTALDSLQSLVSSQPTVPADKPAASTAPPATPAQSEEDHLPEYSWNAFWQTMNTRNISKDQVTEALGKDIQEATPREAVEALKSAGVL